MGTSRRVLLAVLISVGIIIAWGYFFAPKPPPTPPTPPAPIAGTGSAPASQPATSQPSASRPVAEAPAGAGPRAASVEGKQLSLKAPYATATFTTTGAALRHWVLTNRRYEEFENGRLQQVDLVRTAAGKGPWQLTTTFPQSDFEVPPNARFDEVSHGQREVLYAWQSDKVRVTKRYVLDPVRPLMWITLEVENRTKGKLRGRLEANVFNQQPTDQTKASFTNPYPIIPTVSCYANGEIFHRSQDAILGKSSGCSAAGCGMGEGPVTKTGEVPWVGSDNRYFLTAIVPQDQTEARRCELKVAEENLLQASILYPERGIDPGKTASYRFLAFAGPKDLSLLDSVKGAQNGEVHLSDSIEFGWFAIICRPMLWLMRLFYSWFGNWGVAIILLTIIVKLLTLYWTQKSMRSMREMQRLKPKIDILREKFKDDKQRLNQEMMELYKVHKVNPLDGCLPMLLQMPIWFALYRTLGNAVELYRSPFAGWIRDLTAPDPYYILPIAMGNSMYAQQAITPQPVEGTQAKVMKYFMPGMFTVMMLALPSGLTLYIFVNTVLTMIHQWYMNKTDPHRDVKPTGPEAPAQRPKAAQPQQRRQRRKTR